MENIPSGMTYAEYLESIIPEGIDCNGCLKAINGICIIWNEPIGKVKNKYCLTDKYLYNIKYLKKVLS